MGEKNYKYNQVEFLLPFQNILKLKLLIYTDYFQINKFFEKNLINNEIVIRNGDLNLKIHEKLKGNIMNLSQELKKNLIETFLTMSNFLIIVGLI